MNAPITLYLSTFTLNQVDKIDKNLEHGELNGGFLVKDDLGQIQEYLKLIVYNNFPVLFLIFLAPRVYYQIINFFVGCLMCF